MCKSFTKYSLCRRDVHDGFRSRLNVLARERVGKIKNTINKHNYKYQPICVTIVISPVLIKTIVIYVLIYDHDHNL